MLRRSPELWIGVERDNLVEFGVWKQGETTNIDIDTDIMDLRSTETWINTTTADQADKGETLPSTSLHIQTINTNAIASLWIAFG